jgi:hypothetical protein
MENWFGVDYLDVERLLVEWRWLCAKPMTLIARNAYADLFLRDDSGEIYQLDVAVGKLAKVAGSEAQFRELAATPEKRNEWFAEVDEQAAAARGLKPNATQWIGFACRSCSPKAALQVTRPTLLTCTNTFLFWATSTDRFQTFLMEERYDS